MRNSAKIVLLLVAVLWAAGDGFAQQRPQLTHYLFQQLAFNPAYAGAKGHLQSGLSLRSQWMGLEGAPRTAYFNVHSALRNDRLALGFQAQSDALGPTSYTNIQAVYAYRVALEEVRFSAGIQVGMENYRADWSRLDLENPADDAFPAVATSWWNPVIGVGVMAQGDRWYAGVSCPYLIEQYLFYESGNALFTRRLRHLYAMTGGQWELAADWRLFGATLFSAAWGSESQRSPVSWDLYGSVFYRELLMTGLSWQSGLGGLGPGQTAGLFVMVQLDNGLRAGLSFDVPVSRLATATSGSLECAVGYDLKVKAKRVATPRFFW